MRIGAKADTVFMAEDGSLTNQLLIAMPGMVDPNFSTTVTLICEHNDDGALGIVINRPLKLSLAGLFEQLDVADPDPTTARAPVLLGGPVGPQPEPRAPVGLACRTSAGPTESVRMGRNALRFIRSSPFLALDTV